ncbi:MAG TPA: glycosyltransferase family 9 protein [bacterium]|nr:glycosyltransferase family 9 protein [bacterium]
MNTAFLGDVALTTPLFSLLAGDGWTVDALVVPASAPLLDDHPHLNRVVVYDKRGEPGLGKLLSLGRDLRGRYDAVLVPHRSARSAILALLTRAPVRIGYGPPKGPYTPPFTDRELRPKFTLWGFLYTHRVEYTLGRHETLRICDLARPLGLSPSEEPRGVLGVGGGDAEWAEALFDRLSRPVIALFPGSLWETKLYPPERYAAVAHDVIRRTGGSVVLMGGKADMDAARVVIGGGAPGLSSLVGQTDLGRAKAVIAGADLVLANDSGPIYMSSALGTPVVCVFGPTGVPGGFWPFGVPHRIVRVEGLECRPCSLHGHRVCPLGHHRCMSELDPERVVAACLALLGGGK